MSLNLPELKRWVQGLHGRSEPGPGYRLQRSWMMWKSSMDCRLTDGFEEVNVRGADFAGASQIRPKT